MTTSSGPMVNSPAIVHFSPHPPDPTSGGMLNSRWKKEEGTKSESVDPRRPKGSLKMRVPRVHHLPVTPKMPRLTILPPRKRRIRSNPFCSTLSAQGAEKNCCHSCEFKEEG